MRTTKKCCLILTSLLLLVRAKEARNVVADEVRFNYEDDEKPIPVLDVFAVLGGKAELPCDIEPADPADDVHLVLWYRHEAGKPLYSFDARGRRASNGKHWSASQPFGSRAFFRVGTRPTFLLISDVRLEDEDVYRCRVDYRNSPTRNVKLNLTVVVPPHSPRIRSLDPSIETARAIAGVYREGQLMRLVCDVVGGRPLPSVTWFIDGQMVDDSFVVRENTVVNELREMRAERQLDQAMIECRASNNNVSQPQARILAIKISLRPQEVRFVSKPSSLVSGQQYELQCEAQGSKPAAIINWYKAGRMIDEKLIQSTYENVGDKATRTRSVFAFVANENDNGRRISCRAQNPEMADAAIEDSLVLRVTFPPRLNLRLSHLQRAQSIREGEDVYFECFVRASPPANSIEWRHNGKVLRQEPNSGLLFSNQSLGIPKVQLSQGGRYECAASNSQGEGVSNAIHLDIQYAPRCLVEEELSFGVRVGGNVSVVCSLQSRPAVHSFRWVLSDSGRSLKVAHNDDQGETATSIVTYLVKSTRDYGRLSCEGRNDVVGQSKPCVFVIKPPERPNAVSNCSVRNDTERQAVLVRCQKGHDGGMEQYFRLEAYTLGGRRRLVLNQSEFEPEFALPFWPTSKPMPVLSLEITAINERGQSKAVHLRRLHVPLATHTPFDGEASSTLLYWPLSSLLVLATLAAVVALVFYIRRQTGAGKRLSLNCYIGRSASGPDQPEFTEPPDNNNNEGKRIGHELEEQTKIQRPILKRPQQTTYDWYPNPMDQQQIWRSNRQVDNRSRQLVV